MDHARYRHFLLLGALTLLPGCLAANAALGVFGLMAPPVAQLAGAAYTVAECSYEYGVHDRTPDQVFLAKFDWLLEDGKESEPDPAAFAGALRRTVDGPRMADAPHADAVDEATPVMEPPARPVAERVVAAAATPAKKQLVAPKPAVPAVTVRSLPRKAAPRRIVPEHTYAVHAPDPLLTRLDRLESGLAQAERLYLAQNADGVRLSVPPCDGDPCALGVNGGSSLRLPVMRTAPGVGPSPAAPAPVAGDRAGQSRPPSGRSLNT